jgi:hypothetical protein
MLLQYMFLEEYYVHLCILLRVACWIFPAVHEHVRAIQNRDQIRVCTLRKNHEATHTQMNNVLILMCAHAYGFKAIALLKAPQLT